MVSAKRVNPFTVQNKICNPSGLHRSVKKEDTYICQHLKGLHLYNMQRKEIAAFSTERCISTEMLPSLARL
jgi:hypothetical protein